METNDRNAAPTTTDFRSDPLWQKIEAYAFDIPEIGMSFNDKLAAAQKWTGFLAKKAITEYKKFMYLCCISPDGAAPPAVVDEVWGLHATYTSDYRDTFCRYLLGREIHHYPSNGGPAEQMQLNSRYFETLKLYKEVFGEAAPPDIWPGPQVKFRESAPGIVSSKLYDEAGGKTKLWLLLLPVIVSAVFFRNFIPFFLDSQEFIVYYLLLLGVVTFIANDAIRHRRKALSNTLSHSVRKEDKYELAYLAGGEERVELLLMADLINYGAISNVNFDVYRVNRDILPQIENPMSGELANRAGDTVTFSELNAMTLKYAAL